MKRFIDSFVRIKVMVVYYALNTNFYFANPYHSWERGLSEHMPEHSDKCPWGAN